ncbi:MAG TPA: hypothetical protein VEY51_18580, partial [Chondromyces sp.]|nr:hypothetical protein [Chondromyces sp.]
MLKQLKKYKRAFIIIIFLVMITTIRLSWMDFLTKLDYPQSPLASHGVLDLRGWKFTNKQTLQLNGEWEFYPSTFITPTEQTDTKSKVFLRVPDNWNSVFEDDRSFYYGTYRL